MTSGLPPWPRSAFLCRRTTCSAATTSGEVSPVRASGRERYPAFSASRDSPSLLRSDLHELERHPIALADGSVFRVVLVTESVGRRQCPDALGMVLGVFLVRIDFRLAR